MRLLLATIAIAAMIALGCTPTDTPEPTPTPIPCWRLGTCTDNPTPRSRWGQAEELCSVGIAEACDRAHEYEEDDIRQQAEWGAEQEGYDQGYEDAQEEIPDESYHEHAAPIPPIEYESRYEDGELADDLQESIDEQLDDMQDARDQGYEDMQDHAQEQRDEFEDALDE